MEAQKFSEFLEGQTTLSKERRVFICIVIITVIFFIIVALILLTALVSGM